MIENIERNPGELEIKFIDQRYDGLEGWIRKGQSNWIRLDFMLEYYISDNVDVTKQYKGQLRNENMVKEYCNLLYAKFLQLTLGGQNFDFEKYIDWQRNNSAKVDEALKLLNSI
jgi:hypothetical protein